MSPGGSGERRKTSEELLRQLINDDEYLAVLEFSRQEGYEKDSGLAFMTANLKVHAYAYDRLLRIVEIGDAGVDNLLAATQQSGTRLDQTLTENRKVFQEVLSENLTRLGAYVGAMNAAMGAIQVVKEDLEKTAQEAKGVYQFYKRLAGENVAGSLSQQFQRAVILAHENAMPAYQKRLRELIGEKAGWFAAMAVLMTVEMLILGVVIWLAR